MAILNFSFVMGMMFGCIISLFFRYLYAQQQKKKAPKVEVSLESIDKI